MNEMERAIARIREMADRRGLAELSREAGVPYSTVHSFAQRAWSNKNLEVLQKLSAAAERLALRDAA